MYYHPPSSLHACQDIECRYARGVNLDSLYMERVRKAWLKHRDPDRHLAEHLAEIFEIPWKYLWSTPDSWQSIPGPLQEPMREIGSWWVDPLFEGWSEYEFRRQREGRWFTYPPEEEEAETMKSELIELLRETQSATKTLGDWVGVGYLELGREVFGELRRLTAEERELLQPPPGVTQAYHRTATLYTPSPAHRPVAWVEATVLGHLLPDHLRKRVLKAVEPLGQVLAELPGFVRESVRVSDYYGTDWTGERVGIQSTALLSFGELPLPVALVTENVYQAAIDRTL